MVCDAIQSDGLLLNISLLLCKWSNAFLQKEGLYDTTPYHTQKNINFRNTEWLTTAKGSFVGKMVMLRCNTKSHTIHFYAIALTHFRIPSWYEELQLCEAPNCSLLWKLQQGRKVSWGRKIYMVFITLSYEVRATWISIYSYSASMLSEFLCRLYIYFVEFWPEIHVAMEMYNKETERDRKQV